MIDHFFAGVEPGCTPPQFCPPDPRVTAAAAVEPGLRRLAMLAGIDANGLNGFDRIELLTLWEQCQSWLAAGYAEAMAAAAGFGESSETESRMEAARVAVTAAGASPRRNPLTALALTYHPVAAARLRAGVVTYEQVHAVLDEVAGAPLDAAQEIAIELLGDEAQSTTPSMLRREARRRVLTLDPTTAELEAERASVHRQVHKRRLPHGQAEIVLQGPAAGIATIWAAVDAAASVTTADDPRTLDHRRFDALVDQSGDWLSGRARAGGAQPGAGPRSAVADRSTAGAPCPFGPVASTGDRADPDNGPEPTGTASPWCARRQKSSPAKGRSARRSRSRRGLRPTIYLHADARTFAGLLDAPVELEGYGPIPAGAARAMFADATFRAVVTDALTGAVRGVSEQEYRPTARMRRHLHALDRTCGFPGCEAAVWFCDVEHSMPYADGGATDAHNCGLVCRRHHRLKTFHGWSWHRDELGRTVWTTPDGHTYSRDPVRYLAEEAEAEELRRYLSRRHGSAPPLPGAAPSSRQPGVDPPGDAPPF